MPQTSKEIHYVQFEGSDNPLPASEHIPLNVRRKVGLAAARELAGLPPIETSLTTPEDKPIDIVEKAGEIQESDAA